MNHLQSLEDIAVRITLAKAQLDNAGELGAATSLRAALESVKEASNRVRRVKMSERHAANCLCQQCELTHPATE